MVKARTKNKTSFVIKAQGFEIRSARDLQLRVSYKLRANDAQTGVHVYTSKPKIN